MACYLKISLNSQFLKQVVYMYLQDVAKVVGIGTDDLPPDRAK